GARRRETLAKSAECKFNSTNSCDNMYTRMYSARPVTLENQNLEFNGQFYETCPDCLMWSDTAKWFGPTDIRRLLLFTKTGNMTLPNLERFKQQATCLNFTLGLHMGNGTDLCPEVKEEIAVKEDQ
ncbi:hypothetical protein NHX12_028685, partial [Muraenolepis orangiensis]